MITCGMNHLGLAVADLHVSCKFFTELLGWSVSGSDESYLRMPVSDGSPMHMMCYEPGGIGIEFFWPGV